MDTRESKKRYVSGAQRIVTITETQEFGTNKPWILMMLASPTKIICRRAFFAALRRHNELLSWFSNGSAQHQNRYIQRCCNRVLFLYCVTSWLGCCDAWAGTRIFSPHAVAGLCVTIGRYWYLFKPSTAVSAGRFYRFEHIVSYSSFKVLAK